MDYAAEQVLEFVKENDVKFIRLAFCDIFGVQKNISIMADELVRAFETGISFDASAVNGFMNVEESDLFLFPDPSTLSILPWRPQHGRVMRLFCDIKHPDGSPFKGDTRSILKKAVERVRNMGYECKIGSECEFYLFELDERGYPTSISHDFASYCDIAPVDSGENVRREICLTLEKMGIKPESSHHEQGPGQNEIDFKYSDPLTAADNLITFKSVVKTIAHRNGLFASFMPKPVPENSGNGLHINISLIKDGVNMFKDPLGIPASNFIAGIMNKISEMTLFLNPLTNSYARLGEYKAPKYITWSHQNRSQLIRIPAAKGEYSRMEVRSPDPACNPYLAFSLLLHAGIDGVQKNIKLCDAYDCNLYDLDTDISSVKALPSDLGEAIEVAKNSKFISSVLPYKTVEKYINAKIDEWHSYLNANDKDRFEKDRYFMNV